MKNLRYFLALILTALSLVACEPKEALPKVTLGVLPYADHSFAIIAKDKGWFRDAGLDVTLEPIEVAHIIPYLQRGHVEVASTPPGILIEAYDNAPDLISFVFSDLFLGYAVMAQPNDGYQTFEEFRNQGYSPKDAAVRAIQQIKDKTLTYPPENAVTPFISLLFAVGELNPRDVKPRILEEFLTIDAMRDKQADFQVGGAPSRITLYRESFLTLITAGELTSLVKDPSPSSPALAAILQNGWATTRSFYEEHPEIILRLAGVNYRLMQYLTDPATRREAAEIHMAYLSRLAGENFTAEEALDFFYKEFNPFFTFEDQHAWFFDPDNPHYYANINGAIINSWIAKDHFRGTPPTVEDVIYADDTYKALLTRKNAVESFLSSADSDPAFAETHAEQLSKIRQHLKKFNFYDAARLAETLGSP